eukprot:7962398-Alexandrium_andersonii.AAC.1
MSASLVGSEMCIRDSSRPGAGGADVLGVRAFRRRQKTTNSRPPKRLSSCLLYTSDAADDM